MKIEIIDEILSNYLMFKLDKDTNSFTEDELSSIDELFLDCHKIKDFKLRDLLLFPNIKKLTLRNYHIKTRDFPVLLELKKLKELVFDNCIIENPNIISGLNITKLSLINCNIHDYSFVYVIDQLKELTIINGNIDISKLNKLEKLRYLQISDSNIIDSNIKLNGLNIEKLYIDNTNIIDLSFLNRFYSLKILSIDENQYNSNKELIDNLIADNVSVLLDGLTSIEEGGEIDG